MKCRSLLFSEARAFMSCSQGTLMQEYYFGTGHGQSDLHFTFLIPCIADLY